MPPTVEAKPAHKSATKPTETPKQQEPQSPAPSSTPAPAKPNAVVIPPGMVKAYGDSNGIENLFEYWEFATADDCDKYAGKPGVCVRLANNYMRQKSILVDGRRDLTKAVIGLGFARIMNKEKKKDSEGNETEVLVPGETENESLARFKKAVITGETRPAGFTNVTTEPQYEAALINLSRTLGPYFTDSREAQREASAKTPPKYAITAATNIITNGSQAKWVDEFKRIGIQHQPFTTPDTAANLTNLAWAIQAHNEWKSKNTYV